MIAEINSYQDLINAVASGNSIYEFLDDIVLQSDITLPSNITIRFSGGKINFNGYYIYGNYTLVECGNSHFFDIENGGGLKESLSSPVSFKNKTFLPEWFGAMGDGLTNDLNKINQALKFSVEIQWGGVYFSSSDIVITNNNFSISSLKLKNTSLVINATNKEFFNNTISGLKIEFDEYNEGTYGINLLRSGINSRIRDLTIKNSFFYNCGKAINANSYNLFHSLGRLNIIDCLLEDNGIGLYLDENNGFSGQFSISDIVISRNTFNSKKKDCYLKSSDGTLISNNVFFGNSGNKRKSIHLGENLSDQIKIFGNQIFEANEEGILIENVKSAQICDNNIVTTINSSKISSKIRLVIKAIPAELVIKGNIIRKTAKHGIEIVDGSQNKILTISSFIDSNVIYAIAHGVIGGVDLSQIPHFGIYVVGLNLYVNGENHSLKEISNGSGGTNYVEMRNFYEQYSIIKNNNSSKRVMNSIIYRTVSFQFSNTVKLVGFKENCFSLLLKIHCWLGENQLNSSNSGSYLMLVSRTMNGWEEIDLISELGLVKLHNGNPDSWISDNWPAFNFSISNKELILAHKNGNPINETFSFEIVKTGKRELTV